MSDTKQWQELSELHEEFKKRIAKLETELEKAKPGANTKVCLQQQQRIAVLEALPAKAAAIHAKTGGEYATGWRDACAWIAQSRRALEQGDG